jgi:hypothetical protein
VPEVFVQASPKTIGRGQNANFVVADVHGPVNVPVTVFYRMSGNAVFGRNYTLSGELGVVIIPAGESSARVILHALTRGPRTATMKLLDGPDYTVSPLKPKATINIR